MNTSERSAPSFDRRSLDLVATTSAAIAARPRRTKLDRARGCPADFRVALGLRELAVLSRDC